MSVHVEHAWGSCPTVALIGLEALVVLVVSLCDPHVGTLGRV